MSSPEDVALTAVAATPMPVRQTDSLMREEQSDDGGHHDEERAAPYTLSRPRNPHQESSSLWQIWEDEHRLLENQEHAPSVEEAFIAQVMASPLPTLEKMALVKSFLEAKSAPVMTVVPSAPVIIRSANVGNTQVLKTLTDVSKVKEARDRQANLKGQGANLKVKDFLDPDLRNSVELGMILGVDQDILEWTDDTKIWVTLIDKAKEAESKSAGKPHVATANFKEAMQNRPLSVEAVCCERTFLVVLQDWHAINAQPNYVAGFGK